LRVFKSLSGTGVCALRACLAAAHTHVPKSVALLVALALGLSSLGASSDDGPLSLRRGVTIQEWLSWAPLTPEGDYRWPPYRDLEGWGSEADFAEIKAFGFDFVRLSVDPGPLLSSAGDRLPEAVARVELAVRAITRAGLKVVLDLHPVSQVKAWSPEAIEGAPDRPALLRYETVVAALARMLTDVGTDKTALELMNQPQFEPCLGAGGRNWETIVTGLVRAAHDVAPDLTLVVSGACGGTITGLVQLDPANFGTNRVLFSFNFFEPQGFTQQGQPGATAVKGAPWPVTDKEAALALVYSELLLDDEVLTPEEHAKRLAKIRSHLDAYVAEGGSVERLRARFGEVRAWTDRHGVPRRNLLLGAFGATAATGLRGGALDAHRFFWLDTVRREAEELGAAWAYWAYANPYGMSLRSPDRARRSDRIALKALGLLPDDRAQRAGLSRHGTAQNP
jgi:endoglucanase